MSNKANKLQAEITDNSKKQFKVGKKIYKIHRLNNWVALKMAKLIIAAESAQSQDGSREEMLRSIVENRTLAPKCISLMVLRSTTRVKLFYGIYWRYLHYFSSQEDYQAILNNILNDQDTSFFFQNMASIQASNILEKQMTQESTKNIIAKHS